MTTMFDVIERLYVQYLTPPDDQGMQVRLGAAITDDTVEDILLGGFTIPEDEALLRQGSILEIDQELVRVVTYSDQAGIVTVTRGEYGTTPTTHAIPKLMNLNPAYVRSSVFKAVADNIITLYPKLFTTGQEYTSTVSAGVFPLSDPLAVEVLSVWGDGWVGSTDIDAEIVDFHQLTGGRSLILNHPTGGSMWVRFRRRMNKATDETDTLDELGVDERWVNIIMAGAAADLIVGRDIPAAQSEWVKNVLEAESIRVGSRMSIAGGLRQYRNMLLEDASQEMRAEYKPKIHMRNAFKSVV
jgi:hypothetical protein